MTELASRDTFAQHLNSRFILKAPEATDVEMELIQVSELVSRPPQEQFSLIFRAPLEAGLEQRIYEIVHSELGQMELFLVPVGQNENGLQMQAVFNLLIDKDRVT